MRTAILWSQQVQADIPSIVSNSPDFITFVERYKTSKVANATDPHLIAQAVNSLLCNPEEYASYCRSVTVHQELLE